MIPRSLFYASNLYTDQMQEGMAYSSIGRTIALNIIDFNIFDEEDYLNQYRLKNIRTNNELTDLLELSFLELPKAKKVAKNHHDKETMKDLWVEFITAESEEDLVMLEEKNKTLNKAVETLKYISADDILRFEYHQKRKARLDRAAGLTSARNEGIEVGMEKGIEKGIEKGMKKGIKKGVEQGIEQTLVENIKGMISEGFDISTISRVTKLSIEEIKELTKNM